MVVVNPDGSVEAMKVLAFFEPADYLPVKKWFDLFIGKKLSPDLWPGREIHAVTGATMSVRAFTASTRRALAVFALIAEDNLEGQP